MIATEKKEFSPRTTEMLRQSGIWTYQLTGRSVIDLLTKGNPQWRGSRRYHGGQMDISIPVGDLGSHPYLTEPSQETTVAFHPGKRFAQYEIDRYDWGEDPAPTHIAEDLSNKMATSLVRDYEVYLMNRLGVEDIKVVIGSVADYCELAFNYQDDAENHNERMIFSEKVSPYLYGNEHWIITSSHRPWGNFMRVGYHRSRKLMIIEGFNYNGRDKGVRTFPLIVPV